MHSIVDILFRKMPPTVPTEIQNPKSILADRNHSSTERAANEHSSLRVTFANSAYHKQNSSINTSKSSSKTGSPTPLDKQNIEDSKPRSQQKAPPASAGNNVPPSQGAVTTTLSALYDELRQNDEKLKKNKSKNSKAILDSLLKKVSEESLGKTSKKSTSTARTKLGKPKKHVKSFGKTAKTLNKTVSGVPRHNKFGKKLKKRGKSTTGVAKDDAEDFQPAKLNEEYATELNKITQILKAVSNFDAVTSTGAGSVDPTSNRVKITAVREGPKSPESPHKAVEPRRPLSADELKQLLSSITRVVSLHQLPTKSPQQQHSTGNVSTGTPPSLVTGGEGSRHKLHQDSRPSASAEAASNKPGGDDSAVAELTGQHSKKKVKKTKDYLLDANKESKKPKSKVGGNKSRSKAYLRKSRSKRKNEVSNPGRPYSEGGSSVSSAEKDPVQNAAFLRRYYEESTRLANKKSSEEIFPVVNDDDEKPKKKKVKKRKSNASKMASTKSITEGSLN